MSALATGLDRLLDQPARVEGRRVAILAHGASVDRQLVPIHLALARKGVRPALLLGPEHGFYGVEQDMVASADQLDLATGAVIRSLYGEREESLRPRPEVFDGVDLLLIDIQDVGSRYYTYAATATWAAEVAIGRGVEVLVLDRPNPLGGAVVEGPPLRSGFESFVGAFPLPTRHGLTAGELVARALRRAGIEDGYAVLASAGAARSEHWPALGRPFLAPSPNMPSYETALLYPGLCLIEGTTLSEGRGTTRPFRLVGAPGFDPFRLARRLEALGSPGVVSVPTFFRPQFQKHAGAVCGGVELVVDAPQNLASTAYGCRLLAALFAEHRELGRPPQTFWRAEAYEFVTTIPAIDLLAGGPELRIAIESEEPARLEAWIASWVDAEEAFRRDRECDLIEVAA